MKSLIKIALFFILIILLMIILPSIRDYRWKSSKRACIAYRNLIKKVLNEKEVDGIKKRFLILEKSEDIDKLLVYKEINNEVNIQKYRKSFEKLRLDSVGNIWCIEHGFEFKECISSENSRCENFIKKYKEPNFFIRYMKNF